METPTQLAVSIISSNTSAYSSGFMIGLTNSNFTLYSYTNPYDRRKQTGKDWELGKKAGMELRCFYGAQYAAEVLKEMKN